MSPSTTPTVGRTVDWEFAATVGTKLVRSAPPATDYTRRQAIDQLSESARRAELPVREVTGLNEGAAVTEARVIDRAEWVRAATESMRVMTGGEEGGVERFHHRPRHRRADGCRAGLHLVGHPGPVRPVRCRTVVNCCWCTRT